MTVFNRGCISEAAAEMITEVYDLGDSELMACIGCDDADASVTELE